MNSQESAIRKLASKVLPAKMVEGDTWYVPDAVHITEMLVERIEELESKYKFCQDVLYDVIHLDGYVEDQLGPKIDKALEDHNEQFHL